MIEHVRIRLRKEVKKKMHDEAYKNRTYVRYPWWSYVKNLLMQYGWALQGKRNMITDDQIQAICRAIDGTMALPNGEDIMRVVDLVLIKKSHTVAGAAMCAYVSEDTAKRWHSNFIRAVARELGFNTTVVIRIGGALYPGRELKESEKQE